MSAITQSPYWSNVQEMRQYILDRVAGRRNEPPMRSAEYAEDVIAGWVTKGAYGKSPVEMRQVYRSLLEQKLEDYETPLDEHLRELTGLLKVGIRTRDMAAGDLVLNWAFPDGSEGQLSERFLSLHALGLYSVASYNPLGKHVAELVDETTGANSYGFFAALIAKTPSVAVALACADPLLKRRPENSDIGALLSAVPRFRQSFLDDYETLRLWFKEELLLQFKEFLR